MFETDQCSQKARLDLDLDSRQGSVRVPNNNIKLTRLPNRTFITQYGDSWSFKAVITVDLTYKNIHYVSVVIVPDDLSLGIWKVEKKETCQINLDNCKNATSLLTSSDDTCDCAFNTTVPHTYTIAVRQQFLESDLGRYVGYELHYGRECFGANFTIPNKKCNPDGVFYLTNQGNVHWRRVGYIPKMYDDSSAMRDKEEEEEEEEEEKHVAVRDSRGPPSHVACWPLVLGLVGVAAVTPWL